MKNYIITIARGFGSGGCEIASKLSEELGIPYYDRQLLAMASEQSGIDESLFVEVDEKLRGTHLTSLLAKVPNTEVIEPREKKFVSDINLYNIQAQIISELAKTETCIVIGKCADYILRHYDNVISIYIEANRKACVESIMEKMYVSEARANHLIKMTDKYRASYYKYYTGGRDWTNPTNYDMTLNSARIGKDKCVKVIKDYIQTKFSEE